LREQRYGAKEQSENDQAKFFHGFMIDAGAPAFACGD
jgi:hypothetical protein